MTRVLYMDPGISLCKCNVYTGSIVRPVGSGMADFCKSCRKMIRNSYRELAEAGEYILKEYKGNEGDH